jgi:hypothetical protein
MAALNDRAGRAPAVLLGPTLGTSPAHLRSLQLPFLQYQFTLMATARAYQNQHSGVTRDIRLLVSAYLLFNIIQIMRN